jgi:TonB family protein
MIVAASPMVVAGVVRLVRNADINDEIKRRHTALPRDVIAGGLARLDLFFSLTPLPARMNIAYADSKGNHVLQVDTRTALAMLHVDPPPRLIVTSDAEFPREAIERGIARGTVKAELTLNRAGRVDKVAILESDPAGVFDRAAIRALFRYQYEEGVSGRKAAVTVEFPAP